MAVVFQSTLSMRRATYTLAAYTGEIEISIHALHEESDVAEDVAHVLGDISIHALHEESDCFPSTTRNPAA